MASAGASRLDWSRLSSRGSFAIRLLTRLDAWPPDDAIRGTHCNGPLAPRTRRGGHQEPLLDDRAGAFRSLRLPAFDISPASAQHSSPSSSLRPSKLLPSHFRPPCPLWRPDSGGCTRIGRWTDRVAKVQTGMISVMGQLAILTIVASPVSIRLRPLRIRPTRKTRRTTVRILAFQCVSGV